MKRPAWDAEALTSFLNTAVERAFELADLRDNKHADGELSISGVGRCIRESAYKISLTPPDPGGYPRSGRAAWLGTWLHRGLIPLMRISLRGSRSEYRVHLTHGGLSMRGRMDLWWVPARTVIDLKSVRDYGLAWARRDGPKQSVRLQVATYAYALEQAGKTVDHIAYLYVERGTGAHEVIVEEYDYELRALVKARLDAIEAASFMPQLAEREERGPGLSIVCDGCAWLIRCWGEAAVAGAVGPQTQLITSAESAASVLELYANGAAAEGRAKKDKDFARAMLDATEPGIYGDYELGWTGGGGGKDAPDPVAMERRLSELGESIPMKWAGARKRSISVKLAKRPISKKAR